MENEINLILTVVISSLLAGLAMPIGAAIASAGISWINEPVKHGVMAFGGGALLSAVTLVLVPEGIAHTAPLIACTCFIVGGLSFMCLDIFLKKMKTPASQLAAMLTDFIPESIALGAAFATDNNNAFLLAGIIALQNLPEGFSAYSELNESSFFNRKKILIIFTLMAFLGPIAGISGQLWLSNNSSVIAMIMLFASGGILYSIFQDLAPKIRLEDHWVPPMGAVFGFVVGMYGLMITTSL